MNIRLNLALVAIALFFSVSLVSTANWVTFPYNEYVNVTVNNWNYTQGAFHAPAGFAIVTLHDVVNPAFITTRGYTSSLQDLGPVPYWVMTQNGTDITLMLYFAVNNATSGATAWNMATIYYDPVSSNCFFALPQNSSCYAPWATGVQPSTRSYIVGTQNFYVFDNMLSNLTTTIASTSNMVNFLGYINTTYVSPNEGSTGAYPWFVLVSNKSMTGRFFNLTWTAGTHTYQLRTNLSSYDLVTRGGIFSNPFVSSSPVFSVSANAIFDGKTDGIGFESWLGILPPLGFSATIATNEIETEGMGTIGSGSRLYNSVTTIGGHLDLNQPNGYLKVQVPNDSNQTTYYILPPFTTNVFVTAPNAILSYNYSAQVFGFYKYFTLVSGINWSATYSTKAIVPNNAILFQPKQVGYMLLTLPQVLQMGSSCTNMRFEAISNSSGTLTDLGPIPYYIINCSVESGSNPNPNVNIVLSNTTSDSNTYNSFYVYIGSQLPVITDGSSPTLYHNWNIYSGNYFVTSNPTLPYTVNFSRQLNLISQAQLYHNYGGLIGVARSLFSYNGISSLIYQASSSGTLIASLGDYSGGGITSFVAGPISNGNYIMFSKDLSSEGNVNGFAANLSAVRTGTTLPFWDSQADIETYNGITFNVRYVATKCYISSPFCHVGSWLENPINASNRGIIGNVILTTTVPQSENGINYNSTTTINFNNSTRIAYIGDTGIGKKYIYLVGFDIVCLLIGFGLYRHDDELVHLPAILICVCLWVTGVFILPILAIAVVATALFLLKYYINHPRAKRGESSGN